MKLKYLLDTNICVYLIKKRPETVLRKLLRIPVLEVGISAITLSELEYGVAKSNYKEQNKLALAEFMAPLSIVPYNDTLAPLYGKTRALLEHKGIVIGPLDLLIAVQALAFNLILVTNNTKEFERILELKIENWV